VAGPESVEETLSREAEQRPRAGAATVAAGFMGLIGAFLFVLGTRGGPQRDEPVVGVIESLRETLAGGDPGPSLTVRQLEFLGDRAASLIASTLLTAGALLLAAYGLGYLWRAVKARQDELSRLSLIAAVGGGVTYAIGYGVRFLSLWIEASRFPDGAEPTAEAAREVFVSPLINAATLLQTLGMFGLAVGVVLLSMNAMRVGLLTRFMGILGILVGALFVFPLDQPGIVRWFWLVSLGFLFLGRWPNGIPPAWETGRAEPWPSQQELAERRKAQREGREPEPAAPAEEAPAVPQGGAPRVGASKRKRKRRR
jgi:hypothetical protein